jgi:putative endonuclease
VSTPAHRRASADRASEAPLARTGDPRRTLGRLGEELAAEHLRRLGFRLLARNVRTRFGEIDLIVFDGRTIVFAEVKCRRARHAKALDPGHEPLSMLSHRQRARLRRLASAWLLDARRRPSAELLRFDAIGVTVDMRGEPLHVEHVAGAW